MKKLFISVVALAMSMMAMAAETAYVQIRLTGITGGVSNSVYLTEDDAYTNAYESGADAEKIMDLANSNSVLMYGFVGTLPCGDVVALNLDGFALGFTTNMVDTDYKLTFKNVSGRELTLYDRVTKTPTVITNNGTYNFSVESSQVGQVAINDRFVINYVAPAYVIMKGDFANPGGEWDYSTGNFTDNGATFTKELDLAADTWYKFQLEEGYSPAIIAADGSEFNRTNNSHNLPVDGWHSALSLHTDVAGTYTFTWNDLTDNLTITFPAAPANTVTTNSYGFLSFASSEDVEFLGGLKAYKGNFNPATYELTLTEVGTKVPANTGVILWNSAETAETFYYNVGVDASAADVTGNDFVGVTTAADPAGIRAANKEIYCLHGNELMKYVGDDDIPAGKAYLPVTVSGPNPAPKHIVMRFSETQAINNVEAEVKAEKFVQDGEIFIRRGNEVFNLQGQKVNF